MRLTANQIEDLRVVAVFTFGDVENIFRPECQRGGWIAGYGDFCGFAAKGRLGDGRRVRAPLRESRDAAGYDAAHPETVEWLVVGEV